MRRSGADARPIQAAGPRRGRGLNPHRRRAFFIPTSLIPATGMPNIQPSSPLSLGLRHTEGVFNGVRGTRLFEQAWVPEAETRSAVVLVHGYAEHSGRYERLAAHLAEHGHASYTYDHRGFGRSEGRRAMIRAFSDYTDDLSIFMDRVRERADGAPLFLLGHSMGALVAASYVLSASTPPDGLILSSGAIIVGNDVNWLLRKSAWLVSRLFPSLPVHRIDKGELSRDTDVLDQLVEDPLQYRKPMPARLAAEIMFAATNLRRRLEELRTPLLILHGTADRVTDPEGSREVYEKAQSADKTLLLYEGFYHETFNEPEAHRVLDDLSEWINARSGRPSC